MLRQIPSLQATAPRLFPISRQPLLIFRPSVLLARQITRRTVATTAEAVAPSPSPAEAPSSTLATSPRQLSYLVSRTPSNNLSVYNLAKSGGTQKLTTVKKIAGDVRALRREMVAELGLPMDEVNINPVTGHINVKGWHQEKIRAWLEARGF